MDLKTLAVVFGTVFLAELGDKTQLATMLFASRPSVSLATVFAGAALALDRFDRARGGRRQCPFELRRPQVPVVCRRRRLHPRRRLDHRPGRRLGLHRWNASVAPMGYSNVATFGAHGRAH